MLSSAISTHEAETPLTIAVIGAGIVGLGAALELQRSGHRVVIIEPDQPGGRQAASYGNGSWLNPGAVMPISTPGLWRRVPGFLMNPAGPFMIRWGDLPRIAPWLLKFVMAGRTWAQIEACAVSRYALCRDSVPGHTGWAEEAGCPALIRHNGLMFVYRSRDEFLGEAREWDIRRRFGVRFSEIDETELRQIQPELGPSYRFGARIDDGAQVSDTGAYCAALADLAVSRGATRIVGRAARLSFASGRLQAVETSQGPVACDRAVIAAGIGSGDLARQAGDNVPMVSERGYHAVIPAPGFDVPVGLMPYDGKMAVISTPAGLRIAGQVELAAVDAAPNWQRADILVGYLRAMFPDLAARVDPATIDKWMGHRPSTPDGLPVIGPASGCADVFHAFGHGPYRVGAGPGKFAAIAGGFGRWAPCPVRPGALFRAEIFLMDDSLLYLSRADVQGLGITPAGRAGRGAASLCRPRSRVEPEPAKSRDEYRARARVPGDAGGVHGAGGSRPSNGSRWRRCRRAAARGRSTG